MRTQFVEQQKNLIKMKRIRILNEVTLAGNGIQHSDFFQVPVAFFNGISRYIQFIAKFIYRGQDIIVLQFAIGYCLYY